MAVHKVPQDVEADDKFLGPLSFKQFLFMGGALLSGYATVLIGSNGLWILTPITAIPTIIMGFLAFPWSGEQPTELWLAAKIHYYLKPRKRVWDQSGIKDLVTITVPKRANMHELTDGLNQGQVHSRMNALATMVDSRGWAVKNFSPGSQTQDDDSDRLTEGTVDTESVIDKSAATTADIMDEDNGVIAKQFDSMIQQSNQQHQQNVKQVVNTARLPAPPPKNSQEDFWFMHQNNQTPADPNLSTFQSAPLIAPGSPQLQAPAAATVSPAAPQVDEQAALAQMHAKQRQDHMQTSSRHERTVLPTSAQQPIAPVVDPAIMNLAKNNDLNVDTIKRQADRDLPDDEVVISLH